MLRGRRKSQQAEREYEKVKHQLDSLEESVRDRCKKEFTGTERTCLSRSRTTSDGRHSKVTSSNTRISVSCTDVELQLSVVVAEA